MNPTVAASAMPVKPIPGGGKVGAVPALFGAETQQGRRAREAHPDLMIPHEERGLVKSGA